MNAEVTAHREIPKNPYPMLNKPGIHTDDQRWIGADTHRDGLSSVNVETSVEESVMPKRQGTGKGKATSPRTSEDVDPASRFVEQLYRQFEPLVPINSLEDLLERVEAVEIGSNKVPTRFLAPHVDSSIFPIRDAQALREALDAGIARAVELGSSASFSGRHQALDEVTAAVVQREPVAELQIPASYWLYNTSPPTESTPRKRPKTGRS